MMPLRRFTIHQPKNIAEASGMLAEFGDDGRLYAGGTELLLAMKHDLLRYQHLVDVKTIPGLANIESKNGSVVIGGAVTHRAIERSPVIREKLPVFAEMATKVANVRVRATGTLGGNLCFAEPHSDPAALLLALGAKARVEGKKGARTLSIDQLIAGAYETRLENDELLTSVEIPAVAQSQRAAYLKFQIHERPTLGLALVLEVADGGEEIKKARAVVGSISAAPARADSVDARLTGARRKVEEQLQAAAEELANVADPVDDLQGGADYKRHLVGVFLKRAFIKALA